jgi:catechol 2,3-dioxygenase-like lactoylglutathione lyase family enzyme
MPLKALHHVFLRARDLPGSRTFVEAFGLIPVAEQEGKLYFRGAGPQAYLLTLEPAASSSIGAIAFEVDSVEDLNRAVREHGASPVRALRSPGGGMAVSLRDPEGITIDLVHGISSRTADPLSATLTLNQGYDNKPRRGTYQAKTPLGPAQLTRLGHVGLFTGNIAGCTQWYEQVLGLLPTDLIYAGSPHNVLAAFYRLNRGTDFVDHHTLVLFGMGSRGVHHVSFEVENAEVQFVSHRWLASRGYESIWGVGRHPKGSHVFDVWRDPSGFRFETFSDTDLLNAAHPPDRVPVESMQMDLWRDRSYEPYFA